VFGDQILVWAKIQPQFVFCIFDHEAWYEYRWEGLSVQCQLWKICVSASGLRQWELHDKKFDYVILKEDNETMDV
jgi:hypothetical protein